MGDTTETTTTKAPDHDPMPGTGAQPAAAATAGPWALVGTLSSLARGASGPDAIARAIQERGLPLDRGLVAALHTAFGNSVAVQVITALQTQPAPEPAPVETAPLVEAAPSEPKASPEAAQAVVSLESSVAKEQGPATTQATGPDAGAVASGPVLAPAPSVVFDEVGAVLASLGFAASGKRLPIKAHTAPALTTTGFSFTSSNVGDDGRATSSTTAQTDYAEGMGKIHATGALAGSDDVTLNPAGGFTTLIHETVHLYQKGEVGRYLVEPMTEIIASMAFDRLAAKGVVKGSYEYAPEYLPWVVFVSEVIAKKIGWPRLFGYYVGQGFKSFDELAAELGFRPVAPAMKALKEAFSTGDAAKAEAQRDKILAGAAAPEAKRGFDNPGAALESEDHDMSSFEAWLPTFGAVITKEQKPGESNAQTAARLASENKRGVIEGALAEARKHLTTADPSLHGEINAFIAAYEEGLAMLTT